MKKLVFLFLAVILCGVYAQAQTRSVHGTVVSAADNEPLPGATVMPVGGGAGVATDTDGNFTLNVPVSCKHLQVSYVGMHSETVAVVPGHMLIKLSDANNNLDEVIVEAYGTAKKSAYTGSASVIKADVLENALVTDATSALSGKVAGVQILSSNGQPGAAPSVRIRGVGSINAGTNPLYVVDGVPYDGDIAAINTQDIESMTVLKDAAAAALYGARGANGVILVTTKGGKGGAAKVTFDARWGSNSRAISNYDVMTSPEMYVENVYKALYNANYYNQSMTASAAHTRANSQVFSKLGYKTFDVPAGETLILPNGRINPNAKQGVAIGNYYYQPDDWSEYTLRNGLRQEYNMSISGGTDKFNYYVSAAYLNDEGLIQGSHYNRLSTRANMDYQIKPWMQIGTNISYVYTNSGYPGDQDTEASASSGNAFFLSNSIAPYYPMFVRNADGSLMIDPYYGKPVYDYGDGESTPYERNFMSISNPAGDLLYNKEDYLSDVFNGKWFVKLTPVDGLSVTGTLGYFVDNTRIHLLNNPFYGQSASANGAAIQANSRTRSVNVQGLANYRKTFNEVHALDVMVGYESYSLNLEQAEAIGYNLFLPNSWVVSNTIDNRNGSGSVKTYATRGIFGRANYTYDSKYFGSVSYRRDASSRFAKGHRWGDFWSLSAAWDASKEVFMQPYAEWLDMLKVKASFGQQGNDALLYSDGTSNFYPYIDQYQVTGSNGVWADATLYYKGNSNITWETSNNFNAGIDFSLWQGKLGGTVEYFIRQTSDMLYNKPVAPSNGYTSVSMNIGSMRNSGFEIELNYRPIKTRDIVWDINANITSVKNKVLKLHPDLRGEMINGSRIIREGESMYQLYLIKYAGVDPNTGLALYWDRDPQYDANGNALQDANGNPVYGPEYLSTDASHAQSYNRQATGNLMPSAYGGFGTTLQAYGFDLSLSFAFQFGGKIWDYSYQDFMHGGGDNDLGHNWHMDILNAWTPENPYTDVPRLDNLDDYANTSSDRWLVSSNYLSLNNLTVGYTIPEKLTKRVGLNSVRVYFSGENLALWSARKGLDPRQSYLNSTNSTYTGSRCLSGGLRVSF